MLNNVSDTLNFLKTPHLPNPRKNISGSEVMRPMNTIPNPYQNNPNSLLADMQPNMPQMNMYQFLNPSKYDLNSINMQMSLNREKAVAQEKKKDPNKFKTKLKSKAEYDMGV